MTESTGPQPPPPDAEPDWDGQIQSALERVKEIDEAKGAELKERHPGRTLAGLGVVLLLLLVWNVWDMNRPTPALEFSAQEAALAGVLYTVATQLEQYRAFNGAYPEELGAVTPPLGGVAYSLEGEGYILEATAGDVRVNYASWEDIGGLLALTGPSVYQEIAR